MEKIYVQLSSGHGPRECAYAVARLLAIMETEARGAGVMTTLVDSEASEGPMPEALLSATVLLEGPAAQFLAGKWLGTIQWIGVSPYRPQHKRKNWFIGVTCVTGMMAIGRFCGKIAVVSMRASGPGGQNVNKTNSAVRATHIETGISVTARESRSQRQNRKLAHQKLQAQFQLAGTAQSKAASDQKWAHHQEVERGNPTRVFHGRAFTEKPEKDRHGAKGATRSS